MIRARSRKSTIAILRTGRPLNCRWTILRTTILRCLPSIGGADTAICFTGIGSTKSTKRVRSIWKKLEKNQFDDVVAMQYNAMHCGVLWRVARCISHACLIYFVRKYKARTKHTRYSNVINMYFSENFETVNDLTVCNTQPIRLHYSLLHPFSGRSTRTPPSIHTLEKENMKVNLGNIELPQPLMKR